MAADDCEVIRRWRQGDTEAFAELVHRWQGPVARFLSCLVGPGDAVADLCQEVFLRMYRAGPAYRENGAFFTWLYQIALNVARDAARRRRTTERLSDEPASRDVPLDLTCQRREQALSVRQALVQLPAELREVIVLWHYESMSFERMSRLLGAPASTLKSRFSRALRELKKRRVTMGMRPEDNDV
jgi:RNA polymerase sigma-70 factor (ECF subfamily)